MSSEDVWITAPAQTQNKIILVSRGETETVKIVDTPITPDMINNVAIDKSIKEFLVYDTSDVKISRTAFPYNGTVVMKEYNAAKTA